MALAPSSLSVHLGSVFLDVPVLFGALFFSDPALRLTLGRFSFREAGERIGEAAAQFFSFDCRDNESKNGAAAAGQWDQGYRRKHLG